MICSSTKEALKVARSIVGVSQHTMAKAIRCHFNTYCRWETGKTSIPSSAIYSLKSLGISSAFLFCESTEPFVYSKEVVQEAIQAAVLEHAGINQED